MRKFIWILIIAVVVSLTSCGSGSSEEAKELLLQILTIVGIPQDMVVNICQDSDEGSSFFLIYKFSFTKYLQYL
jgi:ABC-type Zn uptake system ZnuABC Zn-binding protein ZnuA